MQNEIEDLQSRVAFLDSEVTGLRDTVDVQQQQILALERLCESLRLRLVDALAGQSNATEGDNQPPPHY
ncbi:MAG: SlyX family protein [Pseudomonadota bacterium]